TGKTPHAEYLLRLLSGKYHTGVLSRGYKRKTTGYLLAEENSTAEETGDEALQVKKKFPAAAIAVCEERAIGIPIMLLDDPGLEVIILDDAFQHRNVKPGLSILLTDYSKLFTQDVLLPAGTLREPKQNALRADAIVVTKCPVEISTGEKDKIIVELKQRAGQQVFFSGLQYGDAYSLFHPENKKAPGAADAVLLVTGIASPESLLEFVRSRVKNVKHLKFPDHHYFTYRDLKLIAEEYSAIPASSKMILTTEKDGVRLLTHDDYFLTHQLEISCMPVEAKFLSEEEEKFNFFVLNFIITKSGENPHD
ncbi:MAG: tetraacyldisaccharide 4'-kinase, partial [Chitinophagales bacterium]